MDNEQTIRVKFQNVLQPWKTVTIIFFHMNYMLQCTGVMNHPN